MAINMIMPLVALANAVVVAAAIPVSLQPPTSASAPIPEAFLSYSIEFVYFPDFAGNLSVPNVFSNNLLNNLGNLQGTKPHIRVGGNTQDFALYNASQEAAVTGTFNLTLSADYPTGITIGKAYFESYETWPKVRFSHGFNLGMGVTAAGWQTLQETAPLACKALGGNKLLGWEYGNEPDLYVSSSNNQGRVRPTGWNETNYVAEWLNGTRLVNQEMTKHCPKVARQWLAPSFAGVTNHLSQVKTWPAGLDTDNDIELISSHNYIGGADSPGVTLQKTLMNHTANVNSISAHVVEANALAYLGIPYILGEGNSLYHQGAPGLSNTFGAALWGLDFGLMLAASNISRMHFHMGTSYRYQSWQPVNDNKTVLGTKAPYYGNIGVAAMMGNLDDSSHAVQIANLPLAPGVVDSAYAAYVGGSLARIAVLNMREYNYTVNGTSTVPNPVPRPSQTYAFTLPSSSSSSSSYSSCHATIQRLHANGSDAITGITFDGWSYNWELALGKPVRLHNVTVGETIAPDVNGTVSVVVADSEAVILEVGGC